MIKTQSLSYAYDGTKTITFPDISCGEQEILLILGKSGVGKTTLLHLVGGLMKTQEGFIKIGNTEVSTLSQGELDRFRGANIGIIFQQPHFVKSISCLENLMLAQSLAGKKVDKKKCAAVLEDLGIGYKQHSKPASLSVGERQRLSIARALINDPKVILADEPTSALDDVNTQHVIELLEEHTKKINAALLIVTHDGRLKSIIANQVTLNA